MARESAKRFMSEAKIELLIRKPGSGGEEFSIREVASGRVYAGYRPRRIHGSGYEVSGETSSVDGRKYYILKARDTEKYLSLNDREYFLWSMMDGTRSIKDIATAYFFSFGILDLEAIKNLLAGLRESGLVEFVPSSRLRVSLDGSKRGWAGRLRAALAKIDYRLDDADGWVGRLYMAGGWMLVSRSAMALYLALSLMGIAAFGRFESLGRFPYRLFFEHPVAAISVVLLSFYPIAAVHELFHALACKRAGRKVYGFGFTLWDGFYPSFYTDVSDIYLAPRRERIYVSLAGPLSTTAIAAAFLVPVAISPDASWAEAFYQIGRFNLLVALISLYPFQFLKMDGYYLLVDFLGFPGLRERTFSFLRGLAGLIRAGRQFGRAELIMSAYFVLSLASIIGFAAYFFESI